MKKLLIVLGAIVAVLILVAVIVPFVVPLDRFKDEAVAKVKAATGRDFRIEGPVSFSLFPSLKIKASKVAFGNVPGAAVKDMASLGSLELELKTMPLLTGSIAIDRFVLVDPVIDLEVDRAGRANWDLSQGNPQAAQAPAANQRANAPANAPAASGGPNAMLQGVRLGEIKLVNGTVRYSDQRSGQKEELSAIGVNLSLPSLDDPLKIDGSVTWHAKAVTLDFGVQKPRVFLVGTGTSTIEGKVAAETVTFTVKGAVTAGTPMKVEGDIDLKVPSVRNLAAWAGKPLDLPGTGFGPLEIAGKLAANGAKVNFTDASFSLDAIKAKGMLGFDGTGTKPYLTSNLAVDMLDVNPYLPPEKPATAGGAKPAGNAPAAGGNANSAAQQQGWSDDPIDASGLQAANADLSLTSAGIKFRKITIGKSALKVHLRDGRMTTDLTQLELYQGQGSGKFVVDGGNPVPAIEAAFTLAGIQAEPLLKDAAEFDRLSGVGKMDFAITGKGKSQRQIVSALNGKGGVTFNDGAVKGIDIGAMIRNIGNAFTGGATSSGAKTDFSELAATYTITNGILKNSDLMMRSPLFRVEGAGTADLPRRTLDYRVTPKVVASTEGQGGRDAGGLMVPVIIKGPWDHLSYEPDLAGALQQNLSDPSKLLQGIKPGAIPGIGGESGSGTTSKPSTTDAIRGLFGGKK